jgi:hypothetical protein
VTRRRLVGAAAAGVWLIVTPATRALAQDALSVPAGATLAAQGATPAPQVPRPAAPKRDRGIELAVDGTWTGSISFGSRDANLQAPDGSSLTLFSTSSRLSAGAGLEAHLSFRITRRLSAEVTGSWTHAELRTDISGDFEGAEPVTATAGTSRFTVEGSALWTVFSRGHADFFVRGGVGWLRDLDENSVLIEDGTIGTIGGGVKYWWRDRPRGAFRKLGLRGEARAAIRSAGISLDGTSTHVSPVLAGGLVIGF